MKAKLTFECQDEGGGRRNGPDSVTTAQSEKGGCLSGGCGETKGEGVISETRHESVEEVGESEGVSAKTNCKNQGDKAAGEDKVMSSSDKVGTENCDRNQSSTSREEVQQPGGKVSVPSTGGAQTHDPSLVAEGKNAACASTKAGKENAPSANEVRGSLPHMNGEVGAEEGEARELGKGKEDHEGVNLRLRSCSAGAAVRRMSVESGQLAHHHERLLMEKRRRRWSLNTPNNLNNSPQVSHLGCKKISCYTVNSL